MQPLGIWTRKYLALLPFEGLQQLLEQHPPSCESVREHCMRARAESTDDVDTMSFSPRPYNPSDLIAVLGLIVVLQCMPLYDH